MCKGCRWSMEPKVKSVTGQVQITVGVACECNKIPGDKGVKSPKSGQERIGQSEIQE